MFHDLDGNLSKVVGYMLFNMLPLWTRSNTKLIPAK